MSLLEKAAGGKKSKDSSPQARMSLMTRAMAASSEEREKPRPEATPLAYNRFVAVEELDEEWKTSAEPARHRRTEQVGAVAFGQVVDRETVARSAADATRSVGDPLFSDRRIGGMEELATPNTLARLRFERIQMAFEWGQILLLASAPKVTTEAGAQSQTVGTGPGLPNR